jgi:hypothetical protein
MNLPSIEAEGKEFFAKSKMVGATGFEPAAAPLIARNLRGDCHTYCHTSAKSHSELAEVAASWASLPLALQAAILAIVRSHDASKRSAQPVPSEPQGLRGGDSPSPSARSASGSRKRGSLHFQTLSTRGKSAAGRETKNKTRKVKST